MPPRIDPNSVALDRVRRGVVDRSADDLLDADADRLPIQVAVPVIIALNLSLWLGIGLVVRAFL